LGIPFYVWDMSEEFADAVVDDFVAEYAVGRTPNPCLRCNESIKFAAVLDRALALGFDGVITGHYAQLLDGPEGIEMHRAVDDGKDQSYVLGVLTQDQLSRSIFPLGGSRKEDVRVEAARRGLQVAHKPDSHDICFVADGDNAGWLADKLGRRPGSIVDETGTVLREHDGAYAFTIGQRRGLRLGVPADDGKPRYVLDIEPLSGTVTVGPREHLDVDALDCVKPLWAGVPPTGRLECTVQLRAHGAEHRAVVEVVERTVHVRLLDPASGIAPGQACVIYDDTRVVGSATIDRTRRTEPLSPPDVTRGYARR
jgi:tRNA-specific 2-thiouridylase